LNDTCWRQVPKLTGQLELLRCPHCNVDTPNLTILAQIATTDATGSNARTWAFYKCGRCGGVVTASAAVFNGEVQQVFPSLSDIDEAIPQRAAEYLRQAVNSLSAPVGAVMLAASAVDAMLKIKEYKTGSLYSRIDQAATDGVITPEMARWAHQVRLDANDQRHADEAAPLPDQAAAKLAIEFAQAMGQFLFVLPSRVTRGITAAGG
jgi:DNA-directed RNA polymerase subunit RPC12/RpoP